MLHQPVLDGLGQLQGTHEHHAGTVLLRGQRSQVQKGIEKLR